MTIIVTGSVAFDYLLTFPGYFREQIIPEHLDKLSVSFLVDTKQSFRGGTGPNIAYSLAAAGKSAHAVRCCRQGLCRVSRLA